MTASDRPTILFSGQHKIAAHHLQRLAIIYVRQSSLHQVKHHKGSQINQYQLSQRAECLNWSKERIRIIDTDLGLSGRTRASRDGFKEMVAEISLGHVGIIFGYEVSRLARNNSDWYHLLDLAAIFQTLIADYDGIYDPRLYNDRLLLGLKGTMSEAELHLIHLRLQGGRKRKIESGEYRQSLPTGLIRQPDGTVVKDPDAQIRHALELLFAKFEELGSCGKVMRYLRDASMLLPRLQTTGPHRGEVLWKQPSRIAIHAILRNPAYAGTFVHGRSQTDPTRQKPGHPYSGIVRKPMEDWVHIHQGIYPAYITWEQYMANQKQLQQNSTRFQENIQCAQGASRRGSALLQGLARCGHCGHRLKVGYKPVPRYHCDTLASEVGGPICTSFHGTVVDEVVSRAFLDALQPAHIDALEAILTEQQTEHKRLSQQWRERLKRAEYEAHLAQRQYNAVDPDNRLVAAELERRWEMKLRQLQKTREEYDRFQHTTRPSALPPKLREQFRNISDTLPGLWESGQISNEQKKRLLRCLISRVILKNERPGTIEIKIVWVSGYYSIIYAYPPIHATRDLDGYDRMIDRIQELWQEGRTDQQIAIQLTSEGFRSARSTDVIPSLVQRIRVEHSWRSRLPTSCRTLKIEGYITVKELASRLGVNRQWISRRIRNKQIDPVESRKVIPVAH